MSFGLSRGRELDVSGWGHASRELPPADEGPFDPRSWFEHSGRPFELEIGSGKGTFLVQQAVLQPETNFLGVEWAGEFYRYAADRMRRRELANVRMLHGDATEFIRFWCPGGIADVVHLYFSDPWPKKRHHKRRVVQDASLEQIHRLLVPDGELRIVTDHDDLWAWCVEHASRNERLFERRPFVTPQSAGSTEVVGTNFERKFAREGRPFHAMTLVRRPDQG
jgi:tRNA (guanine-N7-)-methyltransferase